MAFQRCRVKLVIGLRTHRHEARFAAEQPHEIGVTGIARIGQQHLAAPLKQARQGQQHRPRRAGGDKDAADRNIHMVTFRVKLGDGFAQGGQTGGRGVFHFAFGEELNPRLHDQRRRGEVRLADFHVDDIGPRLLQCLGAGQQFHHVKGLYRVEQVHTGRIDDGLNGSRTASCSLL